MALTTAMLDMVYRRFVRQRWFKQSERDPEIAHEKAMRWLMWLEQRPSLCGLVRWLCTEQSVSLERKAFGIRFPNPVGLAAGFDKNCLVLHALSALGFGFLEGGSITPLHQEGNSRPRMKRLTEEEGLLNRMGFNNDGSDVAQIRLRSMRPLPIPLGISLGKGKETPLHNAWQDYVTVLNRLYWYGDYFVVNVSSPNTEGLRDLQHGNSLCELLHHVIYDRDQSHEAFARSANCPPNPKPILVKVAPDVTDSELETIIAAAVQSGIAGLILANTQKFERDGLGWGRSGVGIFDRALEMVTFASRITGGDFPIIGCGGINGVDRAKRMLDAGACLIQVLTGMIYHGPCFASRLASCLKV